MLCRVEENGYEQKIGIFCFPNSLLRSLKNPDMLRIANDINVLFCNEKISETLLTVINISHIYFCQIRIKVKRKMVRRYRNGQCSCDELK